MKTSPEQMTALATAALLLYLVLTLPDRPAAIPPAFPLLPLELPPILLALLAMPAAGLLSRGFRVVLTGGLIALVVLRLADFGMFSALSRPFNPVSDIHLLRSGWSLASDAVGPGRVVIGALTALGGIYAVATGIWWSLGRWSRVVPARKARCFHTAGAILGSLVVYADAGGAIGTWQLPFDPPGQAYATRAAMQKIVAYRDTAADLAEFRAMTRSDPLGSATDLFARLDGRDVLIVFVESYGRASFDNPTYAPTHLATLTGAEARLDAAGLAMRSGWLTSPVAGGQSWLAHATLASGLAIGDQTRYAAMLQSQRHTLFHLAAEAGYRTVAVMPAITFAWPEGPRMGLDTILAAPDLGYTGRPFNWVTMPDQFTLATFKSRLPPDVRPDFTMIALISSHAPWVPVPEIVAWDEVGDGAIFDRWADSGDPPDVVWRNRDRIRDQYRRAVDYALRTVMDFVAREAGDAPLMIILGDHQPADFVAQIDSHDVPVHLVGPPEVFERIKDWGWSPGLVPDRATQAWPMQDFRDRFVRAFAGKAQVGGDS